MTHLLNNNNIANQLNKLSLLPNLLHNNNKCIRYIRNSIKDQYNNHNHKHRHRHNYTHNHHYKQSTSISSICTLLGFAAVYTHNNDDTIQPEVEPHVNTQTIQHQHNSKTIHNKPILPSDTPEWVIDLMNDSNYMYHDLQQLLDTTGHMIFDSLLHSPQGVKQFYYLAEIPPQYTNNNRNDNNSKNNNINMLYKLHNDNSNNSSTTHFHDTDHSWTPEIRGIFNLGNSVCGHKGVVHGGLSATLIDELSGGAAFMSVGPAFTAKLTVNYHKPLPANKWIVVRAKVVKQVNRKSYVAASIEDGNGNIYATGDALFIKPKLLSMPVSALLNSVQ